jgi:hypothetical protein
MARAVLLFLLATVLVVAQGAEPAPSPRLSRLLRGLRDLRRDPAFLQTEEHLHTQVEDVIAESAAPKKEGAADKAVRVPSSQTRLCWEAVVLDRGALLEQKKNVALDNSLDLKSMGTNWVESKAVVRQTPRADNVA